MSRWLPSGSGGGCGRVGEAPEARPRRIAPLDLAAELPGGPAAHMAMLGQLPCPPHVVLGVHAVVEAPPRDALIRQMAARVVETAEMRPPLLGETHLLAADAVARRLDTQLADRGHLVAGPAQQGGQGPQMGGHAPPRIVPWVAAGSSVPAIGRSMRPAISSGAAGALPRKGTGVIRLPVRLIGICVARWPAVPGVPEIGASGRARAAALVHHQRLADLPLDHGRGQPGRDVVVAAGRIGNDHAHRPLRPGGAGEPRRGQGGCDQPGLRRFTASPLPLSRARCTAARRAAAGPAHAPRGRAGS